MLCTANIARSPLLAEMLRAEADRRGLPLEVASAGVDAMIAQPAAELADRVARGAGLSLASHSSRPLMAVPLTQAELVVGMTRRHRDHVRRSHPRLRDRAFALRELLVLLDRAAADGELERIRQATPAGSRERLAAVAESASARRPVRGRRRLDVPDPAGAGQEAYDELGRELAAATTRLTGALFEPAQA